MGKPSGRDTIETEGGREWSSGRAGSEMAQRPVLGKKILSLACLIQGMGLV